VDDPPKAVDGPQRIEDDPQSGFSNNGGKRIAVFLKGVENE